MASQYEVEVKISSARDLKNVNWRHGPVKPYAVVWVDPARKVSTRVDDVGDTCPEWNETLVIPLDRPIEDAVLHIDVVHAYAAEDTKPLIGSARLPLRDVVDEAGLGRRATRELTLKRPSGRPHGSLSLEVCIRDTRHRAPDPYYAPPYPARDASPYAAPPPPYGAPPPSYGTPYGAPPAPYGAPPAYGAPPSGYPGYGQAAYGQGSYGNPAYGEAAQPVVVEEKKKSKFGGMGVGTGLAVGAVAGALGGLALAEGIDKLEDHIADEAAEKVEADEAAREDDYYDDDGGDYGGDDGW